MTDEQINRAIAEACGWTKIYTEDFSQVGVPCFRAMGIPPNFIHIDNALALPNYCNDLNAMHKAEKVLGNRLGAYGELLCEMTVVSERDFAECYIWHATARQRAEAFLRTLGKWEDAAK